jgi:hypothetical protein
MAVKVVTVTLAMKFKLISNKIQEEHKWSKFRETTTSNEIIVPEPDHR